MNIVEFEHVLLKISLVPKNMYKQSFKLSEPSQELL